jgi:hypothetical protein
MLKKLTMFFGLVSFTFALAISIAVVGLIYNAFAAYVIWNWLAVPSGLPPFKFLSFLAAMLVYSTCFASQSTDLFPRHTGMQKARHFKHTINETILKPTIAMLIAFVIKICIL